MGPDAKTIARVAAEGLQGSTKLTVVFGLLSALGLTYFLAILAGTAGLLLGSFVTVFLLVVFGYMWKRTKALTARI